MYKILLADEEGVALQSLRLMINADYRKECDIRLAANSSQLSEIFPKFQPDLVFVNIQMSGVKGLASIREFHTTNRKCIFIIVSYSNKIDFGREGKNLGIYSYITKPFHQEHIRTLLKNCFTYITIEQKRDEINQYNRQKWEEAVPMLEGGMISEILFPDKQNHDSNLSAYRSFLNITSEHYWLCDLKYGQITEHGTMCNPIGSMVQLTVANLQFRKIVKAFFPTAIIGPILANHVVFMVPCQKPDLDEEEKKIRDKRVTDLCYQLFRKLNLRFRGSIL